MGSTVVVNLAEDDDDDEDDNVEEMEKACTTNIFGPVVVRPVKKDGVVSTTTFPIIVNTIPTTTTIITKPTIETKQDLE